MKILFALVSILCAGIANAAPPLRPPVEVHQRLQLADDSHRSDVAITLDACGGGYDADLVSLLIARRIPATIFVTKRWLDRNPHGAAELLAHADLFELEDHGTAHVPAVVGVGRHLYGMAGEPDIAHLRAEVSGAADAIAHLTGQVPLFYRGAGAAYDTEALQAIGAMGYRVAGFSVNADSGATLSTAAVASRLRAVQPGDIVIAHMNKPAAGTAEGFAAALPELQRKGLHFIKLSQTQLLPI